MGAKQGHKVSIETKEKISSGLIGNKNMLGKKHTEETKLKIGIASKNRKRTPLSEKTKQLIGLGNKNKKYSNKTKRKMSLSHIGLKHSKETIAKLKAVKQNMSDKTKRIMRLSAIQRIEQQFIDGLPMLPCVGKYEKPILDALEKCFGYKIERQYRIVGYFIDGYCPALNLAIEVDEKHHKKAEQLSRDNYRENIIKNELQCNFVRIEI